MTVAEFNRAMVEAGLKKFNRDVEPDKTKDDLRRERNELYRELKVARERVQKLEEKMLSGERGVVIEYVEENPGCTYDDIAGKLAQTAPSRAAIVLTELQGTELVEEDGEWYQR